VALTPSFVQQRLQAGSFWSATVELGSTHPYLCKRVAALREFRQPGSMPPVGRNPFAYLFAPFLSVGGAAGAGGGLLVMVAVIGIIAAIAIPSLLRARVAANEGAAIGHAREVVAAQEAFKSASGSYGTMECLVAPASCIPNYPPNGPVFLSGQSAQAQAYGYERALVHADAESFVYVTGPLVPGQTGIRTFCADSRGAVCAAPSAAEASAGAICSPACQVLR
jgi:type II secretory pathway pseudopilin PulG